ncbi:hypothetical protein J6TS7_33350 [Paenibacillus dendritiformis]|nr:hypothetical protein J6TS7_33350 [Paenibacillus dendritiformis]
MVRDNTKASKGEYARRNILIRPPRANERSSVPWKGTDVLIILVIWRLLLSAPVMNAFAIPLE